MIDLIFDKVSQTVSVNDLSPTISARWDKLVQQAVVNRRPGPTVASRAYGILHTAMYDAWSAYDKSAVSSSNALGDTLQRPDSENTDLNKVEAMSFAAYRVLSELFPTQVSLFNELMTNLGLNPSNTSTSTITPAGIGNVVAENLMSFRRQDGSNQLGGYQDNSGFQPTNANPNNVVDIEKWTPEFVPVDSGKGLQTFLTPQWGNVKPFAISSINSVRPSGPEPFLLVEGANVDLQAKIITLSNGNVVPISLAIVGTDPNAGAIINKAFIEQAETVINISANLTDEQKLIAEFWEDGGGTSFPPGTWMTFGQLTSARNDNTLDRDAVLFFGLGNAVFDAGVATWEAKTFYDYTRPVRAIRELGKLGLLNGGTVGVDELTGETGFVIEAFGNFGQGTKTILAENFITYQTSGGNVSPPFAEYTSGHSAFSAAGAEILKQATGSDNFGASVTFKISDSRIEPRLTPSSPVTLSWDTFSEASDQAGISRLYGGIHFEDGDFDSRKLGRTVAKDVWTKVQTLATGGSNELVSGSSSNDLLVSGIGAFDGINDIVFTGAGNDEVDSEFASSSNTAVGRNRIDTGSGSDTIFVANNDRAFGGSGDDEIFAQGVSGFRISGGAGDDTLFVADSSNGRVLGGEGDDKIFISGNSGGNLLSGGAGADKFWIFGGDFPALNTFNTVTDFQVGTDVIGFQGAGAGVNFNSLVRTGNSIAFGGVTIATFTGVDTTSLTASSFAFAQ